MCNCSLCCLSFRISVEISRVKATILLRLLNKIATTTKVQFNCIWTILFVVAVRVASSTRRTTFLFNCELQRQHHYYHPAVPSLYCVLCIDAGNRHLLIRAGHQQNCSKQQNRINIVLWNEMTFWIIKQTFAFGEFCAFSSGCVRTDTRASVCVSFALQVCVSETEAVDRECESARAFISFLHHLIWHILWALNRGRRCRLSPPQVRTWNAVCCICVCHWNFLLSLFLWVVRNTHWTLCVYLYIYMFEWDCVSERSLRCAVVHGRLVLLRPGFVLLRASASNECCCCRLFILFSTAAAVAVADVVVVLPSSLCFARMTTVTHWYNADNLQDNLRGVRCTTAAHTTHKCAWMCEISGAVDTVIGTQSLLRVLCYSVWQLPSFHNDDDNDDNQPARDPTMIIVLFMRAQGGEWNKQRQLVELQYKAVMCLRQCVSFFCTQIVCVCVWCEHLLAVAQSANRNEIIPLPQNAKG